MSTPVPGLRPFSRGAAWVQTAREAAGFDRRSIEDVGVPQPVLMENAGRAAAALAHRLSPGRRVVALVGSGNNGGDALVALRTLVAWGWEGRAVLVADRPADDPLLHGWSVPISADGAFDIDELAPLLGEADLVLDGILGTGITGAPRERQAAAIEALNGSGRFVLALDVPSGIDASSGEVPGAAVRASVTVSFGAPKLGALLHPARGLVGRHVVVEIGFPPIQASDAGAVAVTPAWALEHRPRRATDTHKNAVGRVVIVGGGVGMGGAAVLAARAAFRAGAGLVQVVAAPENRAALHGALPEAILVDAEDESAVQEALASARAVAAGPGLGTDPWARRLLERVSDVGDAPLVLDADALNLASAGAVNLSELSKDRPVVVTPHPGEMARLTGEGATPRADAARAAASDFGCTVLLKGAPSLVASSGQPLAVDTQSSSDLAVAGMGDALTGVVAALLAQGVEAHTAAALGLYFSGRAARLALRGAGLTPSDVIERLPDALAEQGPSVTDLDLPFVIFDADPAV